MENVKKWAIPFIAVAATGVVLWCIFAPFEETPDPSPSPARDSATPFSSPLDLSVPPPPVHIASSTALPIQGEVREPAIRGHVLDSEQNPIADASVTVYNNEKGIHKAFTDSAGAFAVGGLAIADYRVSASKEHYNDAVKETVRAGRAEVTLVLTETSSAAGRVIDTENSPVNEFEIVYLKQAPGDEALWREIVRSERTRWTRFENPEGRFEIADIASGAPFGLGARANGFEPAFVAVPAVDPGQKASEIQIVLNAEGRVSGHVLSPARAPVAGAAIHLGPDTDAPVVAQSDVDGRFELTGLGESPVVITAYHADYLPSSARVTPRRGDQVPVEIVLGQGGEIEGTIWKGNAPAPGQTVTIQRLSRPAIRKQAVSGDDGRYRITGIDAGLVDILAKWKGPDPESKPLRLQRQAEIQSGMITVVDFHFPAGCATLEGIVTSNGQPVSFAEIRGTVATPEGQSPFSSTAREDGTFRIEDITPGAAWVTVTAFAGQAELRRNFMVELHEGKTAYQEVSFDTASGVSGSVANLAPGEVGQVLVLPGHDTVDTSTFEAILELDAMKSGESDINENGLFTIQGIEPGPYTLVALAFQQEAGTAEDALSSVRIAVQHITVSPASNTDTALTLSP